MYFINVRWIAHLFFTIQPFTILNFLKNKWFFYIIFHYFFVFLKFLKALLLLAFVVFSTHQRDTLHMGCYGIGVSRTLAAICEINCDKDGFKWPISTAPYTFYIVSNENQRNIAEELYQELLTANQKVILDDRKNVTFGAKLKDAKLFGIPYLVIIGNSYAGDNVYEVEERLTGKKSKMSFGQLCELSTL